MYSNTIFLLESKLRTRYLIWTESIFLCYVALRNLLFFCWIQTYPIVSRFFSPLGHDLFLPRGLEPNLFTQMLITEYEIRGVRFLFVALFRDLIMIHFCFTRVGSKFCVTRLSIRSSISENCYLRDRVVMRNSCAV